MLIAFRHDAKSGVPHLRVSQSDFSEDTKHRLERIGSPIRWMPVQQAWDCPLTPAAIIALHQVAETIQEEIEWRDGLLEYAQEHIRQAEFEEQVRIGVERVIRDKALPLDPYSTVQYPPPMRHQSISYHWSVRVSGLYLAHDPGTGKTRSATDASAGWLRHGLIEPMRAVTIDGKPGVSGGVLVIAPKTVMQTWADELAKWQNASALLIRGSKVRKMRLAGTVSHYHVVNYDSLRHVAHSYYQAIIYDELHYAANNTARTEFCLDLARRARKRLGLSGTPVTNSLESLFYQMLIIDLGRSLGPSKTAFVEKYFNQINKGGVIVNKPVEGAVTRISAAIARSVYFVKKEEVLPDLPSKTHTPMYLEMTPEQEKYYEQVRTEAVTYIQDAAVTVEQAGARIMKLMQLCQGFVLADEGPRHFSDAKTDALGELLSGVYRNTKTIVWAYFSFEFTRMPSLLKNAGINHVMVNGKTPTQSRDDALNAWNRDPELKVFVRQLSMSEGVTMHAAGSPLMCSTMIYMGLDHRYINWKQSQDRIHRPGQIHPCSYIYLLTENGIDRKIYNSVLAKGDTANAVHDETKDYYLSLLT